MEPTLKNGERVLINRLAYGIPILFERREKKPFYLIWKEPAVNDIIVFRDPFSGKRYIKRIQAKAGDQIEETETSFHIKGGSFEWQKGEACKQQLLKDLPSFTYFVTGDNLEHSRDSRHFGLIAFGTIEGKVMIRRK